MPLIRRQQSLSPDHDLGGTVVSWTYDYPYCKNKKTHRLANKNLLHNIFFADLPHPEPHTLQTIHGEDDGAEKRPTPRHRRRARTIVAWHKGRQSPKHHITGLQQKLLSTRWLVMVK